MGERKIELLYMYKYDSEICVCDKIHNPSSIYLFKVNNENTRKTCGISSKHSLFKS